MSLPHCETLLLEPVEGVLRITLNRPQSRNAMSLAMVGELRAVLAAVRDDRSVRALVLQCAPAGLAGWRSAAGAPWKIVLKHAEQRLEIGLEVLESGRRPRLLARLERREIAVRLLDCDGRWASAELDGIRRRHAYHLDGGRLWLYGHGGNLELLDVTHAGASAQVGASSGTLKAPMDGAIVEVLVGEGERVGKGQLLLVLEAMKMEHPLKAGVDGVVRRVQVGRGEQVRNRQVLVEVEADA
ncbi:hypothetical protein M770_19065 [Pseudomonas aeruginosa VRFPA03]|nr:hypothetical protein M770_19065 [Pseudomonas aeruginosa VRFPA03]